VSFPIPLPVTSLISLPTADTPSIEFPAALAWLLIFDKSSADVLRHLQKNNKST
jgi:hypothetical protein